MRRKSQKLNAVVATPGLRMSKEAMVDLTVVVFLLLVLVAGAGYVLWSRDSKRPNREQVTAAETRLMAAEASLRDAMNLERLGPLPSTWVEAKFLASGCGVAWEDVGAGSPAPGDFEGGNPHWEAVLSGPPLTIVACAEALTRDLPVWPASISVTSDGTEQSGSLRISVLGSLDQ